MSAASAEVVRPATTSNGKANLFITNPFSIPCRQFEQPTAPNPAHPAHPAMRGYERHEFFNFATEQPSLKRQQMLPFYAFVGKLYTFLESVAGRLHVIWLEFFRWGVPRETTRLYRRGSS
jgi:hypothetical protein